MCLGWKSENTGEEIYSNGLAPAKAPQPLVDLVDIASLPAWLLGNVCTAVLEFASLQVTVNERVPDDLRRVASEKQGHQGNSPQHIWNGAHRGWALERAGTTSQHNEFPSDLNWAGPALWRCRTSTEQLYHPRHTCDGLLATSHTWVSNKVKLGQTKTFYEGGTLGCPGKIDMGGAVNTCIILPCARANDLELGSSSIDFAVNLY